MLPENSLRIFRIHETWMECLISGALAVGRGGETDRLLEAEYRSVVYPASTRSRTGFLLRSPAVDEHPDLQVTAEGTTKEIHLEKIAPGILLGLYEGTFNSLEFSLPPIGLHFGFKENNNCLVKDVKDTKERNNIKVIDLQNNSIVNSYRAINISGLQQQIEDNLTPSSFAFQMCEGTESVKFNVTLSQEREIHS